MHFKITPQTRFIVITTEEKGQYFHPHEAPSISTSVHACHFSGRKTDSIFSSRYGVYRREIISN